MRTFIVHARRDDEVGVWWAESDDVPGLVTESPTMEGLIERVKTMVPDLLTLNGIDEDEIVLAFHKHTRVRTLVA